MTTRPSNGRTGHSRPPDHLPGAGAVVTHRGFGRAAGGKTSRGAEALADAGVAALVLPSLFEEEIVAEEVGLSFALEAGSDHFAEALDYFPATPNFTSATDRYLALLERPRRLSKYLSSPV